jgi:glycerol-3-phosphate acyltransferase PlsX
MINPGNTVLALDAHGGDQGLDVSVPAALDALGRDQRLKLILVGREDAIRAALEQAASTGEQERLSVHHAETVIGMDTKPAAVLRGGRDSSLWKSFELVADGEAGACISGGNTAAMMVTGVKVLGTLPGIQRPALMARVPNARAHTGLLDLGANLKVSALRLVQFAVMGSVTAREVDGIDEPRVGLLNVGQEDSKGHATVKQAHGLLQGSSLNYVGFVEGHDIFGGTVDVAVCDGFAGNLILKSSEGLARMLLRQFRDALGDDGGDRVNETPALRRLLARLDPSEHNGAPLLGLNGVAVKSHGGADVRGMTRAILEAGREMRRQVPRKIEASIQQSHLEMSA